MIVASSLEPDAVEKTARYWKGIDDDTYLEAQYIHSKYNFEKRKKEKTIVDAKRKTITVVDKGDVKDPKLSLIPLIVDPYTFDPYHLTFTADKTDEVDHQTFASANTFHADHQTFTCANMFHAGHGRNNKDQKNFELRQMKRIILNSMCRDF